MTFAGKHPKHIYSFFATPPDVPREFIYLVLLAPVSNT